MTIEQIAKVAHEANRALCAAAGDPSQPPWEEAPEWQRSSAFHSVRFHLENPDAPPSASHDAWMQEKVETGWRHGEVKDADARTHPSLVPFEQLPPEEQAKDHLFRAVVAALAPFLGRKPPAGLATRRRVGASQTGSACEAPRPSLTKRP